MTVRMNKKYLVLFLVLSCIFVSLERMNHFQLHRSRKATNITILLWYWPFHIPYSLEGDICWKKYRISGCHLVDNHANYPSADIVVFHQHELKTGSQKLPLHLPRPVHQRWLWMSLEAPENNGNLTQYDGIFNLTLSYHPGADITVPYGKMKKKDATTVTDDFAISKNKTHLVCWVISNYKKHQRRISVYKQLSKIISVQVYGRAAKKPLSQAALLPTISHCYFYLAFENTQSPHYITEKLWRNAYMAGTVPVVFGPPHNHYKVVAPPHSFIHIDEFDSIVTLATFLKELAGDTKLYKSYFSWHENYTIKLYADWRERLCNICQVYGKLPYHQIHHRLGA